MQNSINERRKNYFIKRKFQTKFIIKFCVLVIIGSMMSGAIIYGMSKSTVTTTFDKGRLMIKSTADFILPAVMLSSAVVISVVGFTAVVMILFTSHKIAGPIYRLETDAREVANGNLKIKFKLRQGDQIKALAESLNVMVEKLRSDMGELKKSSLKLENETGKDKVKKVAADINKILSGYKV